MLYTIAAILLLFWLLGLVFKIGGAIIHVVLVIALIVGLIQLFRGRSV